MQYLLTKEEYDNLVPKEKYYAEIDKLPLSIEYNGKVYNLRMYTEKDEIVLVYMLYNHHTLFHVKDDRILLKTSFRLEELIDRALTIIKNKEWERV